jgi:hypothetical protein
MLKAHPCRKTFAERINNSTLCQYQSNFSCSLIFNNATSSLPKSQNCSLSLSLHKLWIQYKSRCQHSLFNFAKQVPPSRTMQILYFCLDCNKVPAFNSWEINVYVLMDNQKYIHIHST